MHSDDWLVSFFSSTLRSFCCFSHLAHCFLLVANSKKWKNYVYTLAYPATRRGQLNREKITKSEKVWQRNPLPPCILLVRMKNTCCLVAPSHPSQTLTHWSFSVQQTTYRIGNHVYYWVWLRPDRLMWRKQQHTKLYYTILYCNPNTLPLLLYFSRSHNFT